MDESRIKELVEELDRSVPKEGAVISFRQYGGGPDESMIAGSRTGLLRAGIELLRAGVCPAGEKNEGRDLKDFRSLTHVSSEYQFDYFEEKPVPEDPAQDAHDTFVGKAILWGLLAAFLITVGLAAYGFIRLFT